MIFKYQSKRLQLRDPRVGRPHAASSPKSEGNIDEVAVAVRRSGGYSRRSR
jgi:hypothetical protein